MQSGIRSTPRIHGLCDECASAIPWAVENPFRSYMDEFAFDDVPVARYGAHVRGMVHGLKPHGKTYIARNVGALMAERVRMEPVTFDVVTAVPLQGKHRLRGFNQAALLWPNTPQTAHAAVRSRAARQNCGQPHRCAWPTAGRAGRCWPVRSRSRRTPGGCFGKTRHPRRRCVHDRQHGGRPRPCAQRRRRKAGGAPVLCSERGL